MPNVWLLMPRGMLLSHIPQNFENKQKIAAYYRYISWFITSICYLTVSPYKNLKYKALVVLTLLIFSRLILGYYLKSSAAREIQKTTIYETIGLTLFLILTGGIESPFIWYSLNTLFIASNYLKAIRSWLRILCYILVVQFVSSSLFNPKGLSIVEILQNRSYIIFVYSLIAIVMRLLARLVNQSDLHAEALSKQKQDLIDINVKLYEANTNTKQSLEYVLSLYNIINAVSARGETRRILQQMVEATCNILGGQAIFFCPNFEKDKHRDSITHNFLINEIEEFEVYFNNELASFKEQKDQFSLNYKGMNFEVIAARSHLKKYGYLGLENKKGKNNYTDYVGSELLIYLADFIAVVLEREQLEKVSTKLMIQEEQNRIANEIHDNVSQRIFSIICAVHTLNSNWRKIDEQNISKQLKLIEHSIKETSNELRLSIYHLSSSEKLENTFKENIYIYLRDFASLNGVTVKFEFYGDVEEGGIDYRLRQGVYRIIREAASNAVRHGKCTELLIEVTAELEILELMIKDNGQGFDSISVLENPANNGLGLKNMQRLTQASGGIFNLSSKIGRGSELRIRIPLGVNSESKLEQGGAA